jgi:CubicO group peptidase (beta-lactamase class C family)
MESGLLGNYWGSPPEPYGYYYLQIRLDIPMEYDPGAAWNETWRHYSNNGVDMLSAIINETTGMLTSEFAQQFLFDPLGIPEENYHWSYIDGMNTGGSGLYMYPRDMAKLGMLCLYNGTWDGVQVVSSEWMAATLTDYPGDVYYGYLVWSSPSPAPVIYYFGGANGQRVTIIPEYNTVVIITADTGKDGMYNPMLRAYLFDGMW